MTAVFDVVRFHETDLPARLAAGNAALAAADAAEIGPISFVTPSGAWTYTPSGGDVQVAAGVLDTSVTVVELDDQSFAGLAGDVDTPPAMLYQQRAVVTRGNPLRFIRWEPALRAMFHGRAIYDPAMVQLRDRDGELLDPEAPFAVGDVVRDPGAVQHQLVTAGCIVVSGVFGDAEVAAMLAETEVLRSAARPGDGASWWGRTSAGEEVLTRVLNGNTRPLLRSLYDHPRIVEIIAATGLQLKRANPDDLDGVTVLWKLPEMVEGLGDLPWHRDCGMGGHALNCPTLVMSICLTTGDPEAGELRFLPGSQTMSHPFIDGNAPGAPRGAAVRVGAGDLSLHDGDVMHVSLPPTSVQGPHRVSILLSFTRPDATHHSGARHYNDALLAGSDGHVQHLGHTLRSST